MLNEQRLRRDRMGGDGEGSQKRSIEHEPPGKRVEGGTEDEMRREHTDEEAQATVRSPTVLVKSSQTQTQGRSV